MKRILYVGNKLSSYRYTPTGIDFLGGLLERNGYEVRYAGSKKNKVARMFNILSTVVGSRKNYDIILIDTYSSLAFYFGLFTSWTARILGKPYIPILRGGELPNRFKQSPGLTKQILLHAHRVVAVSIYLQEYFAPVREIDYIPNFITLSDYPFKKRSTLAPAILWVRSLHKLYNPELAVRLVASLLPEYPNVFLYMVGPDKDGSKQVVENLASELHVRDHIRLTGKLSKPDWTRLASDCDIFINTTHADNMPVSVIEAMALGLPVVSTNVGGIPFLIHDGVDGLLVADNDLTNFGGSVRKLLQDPNQVDHLSRNARSKVEKFDASVVLEKWNRLLENG